jgi:hypothetical protein
VPTQAQLCRCTRRLIFASDPHRCFYCGRLYRTPRLPDLDILEAMMHAAFNPPGEMQNVRQRPYPVE